MSAWVGRLSGASVLLLFYALGVGCSELLDAVGGGECPEKATGVDPAAVATVLEHIYAVGHGRVVFLEVASDVMDAEEVAEFRAALAERLGVGVYPPEEADRSVDPSLPVLTPRHRETGEIGITLLVDRAVQDEAGRWVLSVGYVRSGLDAQGFDFTLELADDGWRVVDIRETWVA